VAEKLFAGFGWRGVVENLGSWHFVLVVCGARRTLLDEIWSTIEYCELIYRARSCPMSTARSNSRRRI
jgi:hypothetical protein